MPRARDHRAALPWVLTRWLATGEWPPIRQGADTHAGPSDGHHGFCCGAYEAFRLEGSLLHPWSRAEALDELSALWERHHAAITAACAPGERPWVLEALEDRHDD